MKEGYVNRRLYLTLNRLVDTELKKIIAIERQHYVDYFKETVNFYTVIGVPLSSISKLGHQAPTTRNTNNFIHDKYRH